MEGPFWPALLGRPPQGYLPEPTDTIWTFSDCTSEELFAKFGIVEKDERSGNEQE